MIQVDCPVCGHDISQLVERAIISDSFICPDPNCKAHHTVCLDEKDSPMEVEEGDLGDQVEILGRDPQEIPTEYMWEDQRVTRNVGEVNMTPGYDYPNEELWLQTVPRRDSVIMKKSE